MFVKRDKDGGDIQKTSEEDERNFFEPTNQYLLVKS